MPGEEGLEESVRDDWEKREKGGGNGKGCERKKGKDKRNRKESRRKCNVKWQVELK